MEPWQVLSLGLDAILVILTVAMFAARPRIGGDLGSGVRLLVAGFLVLGVAFIGETALFIAFPIGIAATEVIHRLLIGMGFVLIIWGFSRMRRALKR
jgi:hypothetical protein